jgi:hypothetical protein
MKPHEIEQVVRPFKVAIKSLLKVHLPPLLKHTHKAVVSPVPDGAYMSKVFDVPFTIAGTGAPEDTVTHILNHTEQYRRIDAQAVKGIEAAVHLHSKMQSVKSWLSRHPDPRRIPMIRGASEEPPLPEDQEINDLLLEAHTLAQIYKEDHILLFQPKGAK